jgi:hypothetical protein
MMADYRAYIVGEDGHFLDCKARTRSDGHAAVEGQLARSIHESTVVLNV